MSIFRSAFTVSFFIAVSRIFGFIRDIFIAHFLGVSILSDAFFAAFRLPNFFRRVFGEGAMNSSFVPIFVALNQEKNSEKKKIFAQNVFSLLFYFLLIFTFLMQIFMPLIMKVLFPGFYENPEQFILLVGLSRITIFYLIFISLVALCSSILNSLGKFAAPSASAIILNVTLILSFFIFGKIVPNYAYALSWGVFVAGILQFIWLMFFTFRQKILLYPRYFSFKTFTDPNIKNFFKKFLPGIIGANVMQINLLIDSIFASMIFGAMSYLYYADRVNQLPLAMIGIAIGIALLPSLSRKIKENDIESAIKLQNKAMQFGLFLVIPASFALISLANPIISTLFERGKFSANETILVAKALQFYAIGLPAYVMVKVFEPGFFARGNTKTPMKIAFICMISNAIFNIVFFLNGFGYIGIVLSSVISSYLNLSILLTKLIGKKHFYFVKGSFLKIVKVVFSAGLMVAALFLLKKYFADLELNNIFELLLLVISGGVFYILGAHLTLNLRKVFDV